MRLRRILIAFLAASLVAAWAYSQTPSPHWGGDGSVRINQIQLIGSHNSYHAGLLPGIAWIVKQRDPNAFASLDYAHGGLDIQLSLGVRQIELDIFADSQGGRFAHPTWQKEVAKAGLPTDPDTYPEGVMLRPGFKVMHMQDLDYASNCQPFVA